jgi:hypothetical protein
VTQAGCALRWALRNPLSQVSSHLAFPEARVPAYVEALCPGHLIPAWLIPENGLRHFTPAFDVSGLVGSGKPTNPDNCLPELA